MAHSIKNKLSSLDGSDVPLGIIDITLYRDDIYTGRNIKPFVGRTEIDVQVDGKTVILVDDVLHTGRTIRAALDAIMDFGRPSRIQLAVLIDRGERELPISADYVGCRIPARADEQIEVNFRKTTGVPYGVVLLKKG